MKGESVQELLGEIPSNAEEMAIPKELRENVKMLLSYWPKLNFDLKGTWFGHCTCFFL